MSTLAFDTHAYIKKLEAVGVTEAQAEVQAQALTDLINDRLATKDDLLALENRLIIKVGGMMVVLIGVLIGLRMI